MRLELGANREEVASEQLSVKLTRCADTCGCAVCRWSMASAAQQGGPESHPSGQQPALRDQLRGEQMHEFDKEQKGLALRDPKAGTPGERTGGIPKGVCLLPSYEGAVPTQSAQGTPRHTGHLGSCACLKY